MTKTFIGIDVCEEKLDLFVFPHKKYEQFNNSKAGIKLLLKFLEQFDVEIAAMEATGRLEDFCAEALMDAGYNVSVINPARICFFRKSLGLNAKTDLIDAEVIARFAAIMKPRVKKQTSGEEKILHELIIRRDQTVNIRVSETLRLRRVRDKSCEKDLQHHIKYLNKRIALLEEKILQLIEEIPEKKRIFDLLITIPGIGKISAINLICSLPELGLLNHKQIASLAGVSPSNVESGKYNRHKGIKHTGRRKARSTLYLIILSGIRYNPFVRKTYRNMLAKGKPKMVAMGACMRKLIIIANSMIKEDRAFFAE